MKLIVVFDGLGYPTRLRLKSWFHFIVTDRAATWVKVLRFMRVWLRWWPHSCYAVPTKSSLIEELGGVLSFGGSDVGFLEVIDCNNTPRISLHSRCGTFVSHEGAYVPIETSAWWNETKLFLIERWLEWFPSLVKLPIMFSRHYFCVLARSQTLWKEHWVTCACCCSAECREISIKFLYFWECYSSRSL